MRKLTNRFTNSAVSIVIPTVMFVSGLLGPISTSQKSLASPPPPNDPIPNVNDPVMDTYDVNAKHIIMRYGKFNFVTKKGFGYVKLFAYHNLSNKNVIKLVLHNPYGGQLKPNADGTTYNYLATALKWRCNKSKSVCHLEDKILVKVVVNFRFDLFAAGQKGVVNGFCLRGDEVKTCPNWVNQPGESSGNNVQSSSNSDTTSIRDNDDSYEGLALSYTPYQVGSSFYKTDLKYQTSSDVPNSGDNPSSLVVPLSDSDNTISTTPNTNSTTTESTDTDSTDTYPESEEPTDLDD